MIGHPNPKDPQTCFSCEEEVWFVYRVDCPNCSIEHHRPHVHMICTGCKLDLLKANLITEVERPGHNPLYRARSEGCPTLGLIVAMKLMS